MMNHMARIPRDVVGRIADMVDNDWNIDEDGNPTFTKSKSQPVTNKVVNGEILQG